MADMLVKLYDIDWKDDGIEKLKELGIIIRRPLAPEMGIVTEWVGKHFGGHWESECAVAFARRPVSCFIAVRDKEILGFGCYEATCRNFFGPTGVLESQRGLGIGKSILLACMKAMYDQGYGYAIIGGVGPVDFYKRTVGAILIEDSAPGIYAGLL